MKRKGFSLLFCSVEFMKVGCVDNHMGHIITDCLNGGLHQLRRYSFIVVNKETEAREKRIYDKWLNASDALLFLELTFPLHILSSILG